MLCIAQAMPACIFCQIYIMHFWCRSCLIQDSVDIHSRSGRHLGLRTADELVPAGGSSEDRHHCVALLLDRSFRLSWGSAPQSYVVSGNICHHLRSAGIHFCHQNRPHSSWLWCYLWRTIKYLCGLALLIFGIKVWGRCFWMCKVLSETREISVYIVGVLSYDLQVFFQLLSTTLTKFLSLRAARILHNGMLAKLLRWCLCHFYSRIWLLKDKDLRSHHHRDSIEPIEQLESTKNRPWRGALSTYAS